MDSFICGKVHNHFSYWGFIKYDGAALSGMQSFWIPDKTPWPPKLNPLQKAMSPARKQLAVIGDPVAHSLSPAMQNAALRELSLPFTYRKIHVRPPELKKFMKQRAPKLAGFNCTLPHKEAILEYLDWISPVAQQMGAVNTVVQRQGKFFGFNTDGTGYLKSLEEEMEWIPQGKKIAILGAGGAARGLALALAAAGASELAVCNRTLARAKTLVAHLKRSFPKLKLKASPLNGPGLERALTGAELLVNTTTLGMEGNAWQDFPWQALPRQALVSDIIYHRRITPLLRDAKTHGHLIHTGEGMLVHQGALAFLLWTGHLPNTKLMYRELRKAL
jgi:shikimate dehydrogenase